MIYNGCIDLIIFKPQSKLKNVVSICILEVSLRLTDTLPHKYLNVNRPRNLEVVGSCLLNLM